MEKRESLGPYIRSFLKNSAIDTFRAEGLERLGSEDASAEAEYLRRKAVRNKLLADDLKSPPPDEIG